MLVNLKDERVDGNYSIVKFNLYTNFKNYIKECIAFFKYFSEYWRNHTTTNARTGRKEINLKIAAKVGEVTIFFKPCMSFIMSVNMWNSILSYFPFVTSRYRILDFLA